MRKVDSQSQSASLMRKDDSQAQSASHRVLTKMRIDFFSIFVLCITTVVVGCSGNDNVLTVDVGDATESETKTFLVKCKGSCKDINATVKVEAGDPDIFASEYEPPKIGVDSMIEVSCSTVGGGDPGKSCIFPFKFHGVINKECTLEGSGDGIPWCSTLTDENGTHVSRQGKWGHCDPECLQTTIVSEPSGEKMCWLKHRSKFKMMASCSQMSTNTSESFYVTILASQGGYKQGNLIVSGTNPEEIKDPCFTLPDEDNSPRLCRRSGI